jgi:hypothetical protein
MNSVLDYYKNIPLSNFDIQEKLGDNIKIIMYPDLKYYNNLDELLNPYGAFVILYLAKENFGHWCCVIRIDNQTIEFFDPYGTFPDDELKYIPEHFRNKSGQYYPLLTWLLYNSRYPKLTYNEYQFQKKSDTIQTCGRHCIARILFKNLPLKKYVQLFKNTNPDDIVTFITEYLQ